jgi:hypothetical protein
MDSPAPIPIVTRVVRNGSGPPAKAEDPAPAEVSGPAGSPTTSSPGRSAAPPVRVREQVELPPERRLSAATLAGLAAAAGIAAIVLGGWAFVTGVGDEPGGTASGQEAAPPGFQEAVALLARPGAERLRLRGSVGRIVLVVQPGDHAALVLNGLGEAPSGWAYQAWVTPPRSLTPRSSGLFSGREIVVPLATSVRPGATVSVTLEPATGSLAPTRPPKLVVERPA